MSNILNLANQAILEWRKTCVLGTDEQNDDLHTSAQVSANRALREVNLHTSAQVSANRALREVKLARALLDLSHDLMNIQQYVTFMKDDLDSQYLIDRLAGIIQQLQRNAP